MLTTADLPYAMFLATLAACGGPDLAGPSLGSIQVTVATNGNAADLDTDGYTVTIDDGSGQSITIEGSVTFNQVTAADHSVALSGLASNCYVPGLDPVTVTVRGGSTARASFLVNCAPPGIQTGNLEVSVATSGSPADLDPDGYIVSVDGGASLTLAINGSVAFSQLMSGSHIAELSGLASNCIVSGENPVAISVVAGGTAHADFQISCASEPGLTGRIAFVSDRDGSPEIYVMNADGSGVTRLTSDAVNVSPAWSPDGSRIVFMSNRDGGNEEIYVVNADGTNVTRLTNEGSLDEQPAWSPDGKRIAFQSNRSSHFEIYVMSANGSGIKRLTTDLPTQCRRGLVFCRYELFPAWAPDGGKIAFAHRASTFTYALDVMNADGTRIDQPGVNGVGNIAWSLRDKIAFDRAGNQIVTVNPDGTGLTQITSDQSSNLEPAWSPDGSMLVFSSDRDGNKELYAMNADGTGIRRLTYDGAADSEPAWGP